MPPESCKPSLHRNGLAFLFLLLLPTSLLYRFSFNNQKTTGWPGVVTHVCNPSAQGAEAAASQAQPGLCNKTCLKKTEQRQLANMQIYIEILVLETPAPSGQTGKPFIHSTSPEVDNTRVDTISHSTCVSWMPALNLGFLLISLGPRMPSGDI